jgi:hypothetical protein
LSKDHQKVLREFRELNQLPPVLIEYDDRQGFYCTAATDIPEYTLLAEYCGEVRTEADYHLYKHNDSVFELLQTGNQETSLNVVPERWSNIGRFFSGINNSVKGSKKKDQNVRTMRCQMETQALVLLYTNRRIRKGDQLRFDYNEANTATGYYPTHNFV